MEEHGSLPEVPKNVNRVGLSHLIVSLLAAVAVFFLGLFIVLPGYVKKSTLNEKVTAMQKDFNDSLTAEKQRAQAYADSVIKLKATDKFATVTSRIAVVEDSLQDARARLAVYDGRLLELTTGLAEVPQQISDSGGVVREWCKQLTEMSKQSMTGEISGVRQDVTGMNSSLNVLLKDVHAMNNKYGSIAYRFWPFSLIETKQKLESPPTVGKK